MVILFPRTCGRSLCIYLSARISVSFVFYTLRLFNNTIYIARKMPRSFLQSIVMLSALLVSSIIHYAICLKSSQRYQARPEQFIDHRYDTAYSKHCY